MIEVRGNRLMRSEPIGDGHLWPVPPSARSCECSTRAGDAEWEGELSCRKEVTVGSFAAGGLWVQVCYPAHFVRLEAHGAIRITYTWSFSLCVPG